MGVSVRGFVEYYAEYASIDSGKYMYFAEIPLNRNISLVDLTYEMREPKSKGLPDDVSDLVRREIELYSGIHWLTADEVASWLQKYIEGETTYYQTHHAKLGNYMPQDDSDVRDLNALIVMLKTLTQNSEKPARFVFITE